MSRGAGPEALLWLREVSGLTQRGLASRSGISERTIRGLERGQVETPHRASLQALASAAHLDDLQTAAFLRAWAPDRVRYLTELAAGSATFESVVAETILQAEVEENLVASWTRFRIRDHRVSAIDSDFVVEARRDGVETYVIPYIQYGSDVHPQIETSASGCTLRHHHVFDDARLSVFELALPRRLAAGESAAFRFDMTLSGFAPRPPDETEYILRMLHRQVPLTVIEMVFEDQLPPTVWEVEMSTGGERRRLRAVPPSRDRRVHLVQRNARPGSYGFEWSVGQQETP